MTTVKITGGGVLACRPGSSAVRRIPGTGTRSHYTTVAPGVKPERSHWRDEGLSLRHRLYGFDCPALDLDFILMEYDAGRPVALVEYKALGAPMPDSEHPSLVALRRLADSARIPCLMAFYSPVWSFSVYPLNDHARERFTSGEVLSELEYVTRLYELRGRELSADVACRLNQVTAKEGKP